MNPQDPDSQKNDHKTSEKDDEPQTLVLLQKIKDGQINPKSIGKANRIPLVRFLKDEGQSTVEIAHLLDRSEKTIQRDKEEIEDADAIIKDPKLLAKMLGKLASEAELCKQRTRKFQRDRGASPADKMEGERLCFQFICRLTERMQSLGHLPTAAQKIEADMIHRAASSLTLGEIQIEAGRLKQIQESLPAEEIKQADSVIEANETVTEFEDDSPQQDNKGDNHETIK